MSYKVLHIFLKYNSFLLFLLVLGGDYSIIISLDFFNSSDSEISTRVFNVPVCECEVYNTPSLCLLHDTFLEILQQYSENLFWKGPRGDSRLTTSVMVARSHPSMCLSNGS